MLNTLPLEIQSYIFQYDSTFVDILRTQVFQDIFFKMFKRRIHKRVDWGYSIRNFQETTKHKTILRYWNPQDKLVEGYFVRRNWKVKENL